VKNHKTYSKLWCLRQKVNIRTCIKTLFIRN